MPTSGDSALGRGALFAKAACLTAMAASVASTPYAAAGSLRQQDYGKQELGGAAEDKKMAVVFPITDVVPALGRIAAWSTACSSDFDLPIDLILYVAPNGAQSYDLVSRTSSRFDLLDMPCFEHFNFVLAENIYEIFTDDVVRQHFDEYDAIAVLDWKNIEVHKDSFAKLYLEVFGRPRSRHWWVMAADGPPLKARDAEERSEMFEKRLLGNGGGGGGGGGGDAHLVWSINNKAVVFNNRSRGLRRFFRFEMSPLLRDQPFDLALWATLSFTPPTNRRWGGILLRLVTVDGLIGSPSLAVWEGPGRPIFLDTSVIDWIDNLSASASDSDSTSSFFVDAAHEARNGGVLRHTRPNDHDHQQQQQQIREDLMQASWELDRLEEREEWVAEAEALEEQVLGEINEVSWELDRLEEEEEEEWVRAAQAGARRDAALDDRSPTTVVGESWLPFTDALRRGQVCVFIPAYAHQRAFAEVTVESILRFMPGVRVAIAVDPSELEDYHTYFGPLDGVGVTRSVDVNFSAVTADIRCGEGTELILYLEPGTLLSRPLTHADTHDTETGDLLVMYTTPGRAGRTWGQAAFGCEKLLETPHPLPLFSVGTDLLLPASANRDLRESLWLSENRNADWEIHLVSLGRGCREPEVSVPQALASAAFLARRPGAVFLGSPGREEPVAGVFENHEIRQLVLKPRFGCQFFPRVHYSTEGTMPLIIGTKEVQFCEDELEIAATSLREQLAHFLGGEDSCASGLNRLEMDPANISGGLVGGREEDEATAYNYLSSGASATLVSDGERNGHYSLEQQQQQGSNHAYGVSSYSSYLETVPDRSDDADALAIASRRSNAGPSSLETGHDGDSYDDSYKATFLRSSRHAAAAADAANAAAAREAAKTIHVSAAADTENEGHSFHALGERSSSAFFVAPEIADYHWPAGAEDISESSVDGFAYYYAELARFPEDAGAASESARAAAYASAVATAASAAKAAAAAADAADAVDSGGVPSADEATDQATGGNPQGFGHGFGRVALA
eukprot:g15245.t1